MSISYFSGNRAVDRGLDPEDWMRMLRVHYRTNGVADAERLDDVADRFKAGSPADKWFKGLDTAVDKVDWGTFMRAFKTRFPDITPVEKPRIQFLAEVAGMRISMESLAQETVLVGGVRVSVLRDLSDRVNDVVVEAAATSDRDAGLFTFYSALPPSIRGTVEAVPATWGTMVTALRTVPQEIVEAAVVAHKREKALEEKLERLGKVQDAVDKLTKRFESAKLSAAGGAGSSGQRGAGVQTAQTQQQGAGVQGGRACGGAAAGGGRGGGTAGGGQGRRPPLTEAEKAALQLVFNEVVSRRAPDTAEGRVLYETQKANWAARTGHISTDNISIDITGFPLTPGTATPASGECWTCGMATQTPHLRTKCPRAALPELESRFRAVCGLWLGGGGAPRAQVNEVAAVVPWWEMEGDGDDAATTQSF
ncbi:hypothetical protein B0H16DRAFT_479222 [Mycena metata]|uniref:Uncharacterized protein n=1 Tax=Mycena metata TaxID=1033252 RepID=A0AAD7P0V1_9AGAR|nr:hypothetical protein B0H16DRAFT_479222 [Mycena metata]